MAASPEERRCVLQQDCGGDAELFDDAWNCVVWEQRMEGFLLEPLIPPVAAEHPFQAGDLLDGRFRITRELARGGMGIVYEAADEKLDRRIALKCAKTGFGSRLPPEVRHATEISHPNVCKIFEIHTASTDQGEIDFLTMELLEGETLAAKIRSGPLPHKEARAIALQLCAGLAEAHRKGVIHGDLKANNVIVTYNADGVARAVITDFGLARKPDPLQTKPEQHGGTPDYMAPELLKGGHPSVASDIYALGVMLHELVRGCTPQQHTVEPGTWDRVIQRCVEPDPERRFRSAEEVARAIAPIDRRLVLALVGAIVLALVSGLVMYWKTAAAPESVRLAVLSFDAGDDVSLAMRLSVEASEQVGRLIGNDRTKFRTIPVATSIARKVDTAKKARSAFGATHVLHATLKKRIAGWCCRPA